MKIAIVKEVKDNLSQFLKKAEQEDVGITKNGRPKATLHHLGENELEDYLLEHVPKFKQKIKKRWKDYLKNGGVSMATISSSGPFLFISSLPCAAKRPVGHVKILEEKILPQCRSTS